MKKLLINIIFLAWIWVLMGLLIPSESGKLPLEFFLRPDLWWLIAVGIIIMILFLIVGIKNRIMSASQPESRLGFYIRYGILFIPIPFILSFGKNYYGTDVLSKRLTLPEKTEFSKTLDNTEPDMTSKNATELADTSLDLKMQESHSDDSVYMINLLTLTDKAEPYQGKIVNVKGILYKGDDIPAGYVFCFRYVMVCCAADARPVGILIKDNDSVPIENDAWYDVEGIISLDSMDGIKFIRMDSASFQITEKPKDYWLYPQN